MRAVKHPDFLEQNNSDTTSLSLTDFGAQLREQRFDVTPLDVCTGRAGEEQVERALVLALYAEMVPPSGTDWSVMAGWMAGRRSIRVTEHART